MGKSRKQNASQVYAAQSARRLAAPRLNFGDYTESVMSTYSAHEKELYIDGLDPAAVMESLAAYRAALTQEHELEAQLAQARETRQQLAANVWTPMLDVYQRALSAARTNPIIKHAIAAFEQFMKVGHPKKKETMAPPPA